MDERYRLIDIAKRADDDAELARVNFERAKAKYEQAKQEARAAWAAVGRCQSEPVGMIPTHPRAGSNPVRQSVGDPGHCEACAEVGHVTAHPDLGCGDVGCSLPHGPEDES